MVGYDDNTTYVQFTNGNIYKYPDTSQEAFDSLVKAESVGQHFGKTYRHLQKYEKLENVVLKSEEKKEEKQEADSSKS